MLKYTNPELVIFMKDEQHMKTQIKGIKQNNLIRIKTE